MATAPKQRMDVDEFLAWAQTVPGKHELVDGQVWAMSPERTRHARAKFAVQRALHTAIGRSSGACELLPDGMTVRIDRATAYEPDALIYCGPRLPGDAIEVPEPLVVIEVLSPSTRAHDSGVKLTGYFSLASVQHYLLVDADRRLVIHHRRGAGDLIETRILSQGMLRLDPPGIEAPLAEIFVSE